MEGPSKADIDCHDNEDGSCRVTYRPTEPGDYLVNIKFADEHVPGGWWVVGGGWWVVGGGWLPGVWWWMELFITILDFLKFS